ncbi:MAG: ABC transporter permease [Deltaproteobacteria bacterium]|nr:ABC transporter permease [Deltaproteobacteria bacterium]
MKIDRTKLQREIDLLWILTRKEIILQYKRTSLGIFWSLLNPLLLAFVFYIAFNIILGVHIPNFPLFILSALFPWTWFSTSVSASTVSLISNKSLIKKFPFPKHYLLIASVLSQGIHFVFSLPIIIILVYVYGKHVDIIWLTGIPILLIIQFMITIGLSLAVSVINVYFMDFQFIVGFLLQVLFWITPIVYKFDNIPEIYRTLFLYLNPLASLMSSWRELFMSNKIYWNWIGIALLGSISILFLGLAIFRRLSKRIDEVV